MIQFVSMESEVDESKMTHLLVEKVRCKIVVRFIRSELKDPLKELLNRTGVDWKESSCVSTKDFQPTWDENLSKIVRGTREFRLNHPPSIVLLPSLS